MSLIRSSLLVGLGTVASRILGFVRDVLFAQALGTGPVADAFLAAFRLPNVVRRMMGEGGLNAALIPGLSSLRSDEAAATAGDVLTAFALVLLGLTGLVEIGAGVIAMVLAPGFQDDGDTLALVALYTRLAFPAVICVTLASVASALLNLHGRFGATAVAPLAVNGGMIAVLIALETSFALPQWQKAAWLSGASSAAGLAQLAIVALALRGSAVRAVAFRRPRLSPVLKSVLLAGFPALLASGAVQLFSLVGTQVASFWPSGVSWLYYGDRLVQLPLSLMAAVASSVLLPDLASRHRSGDAGAVVAAQNRALELALLMALPAAAALMVLAGPIASVLFERGAFTSSDAQGTAYVLMALSLGLPVATAGKVLSQTLFARGSLRETLLAALLGIAVTASSALLLGRFFEMPGIAFGISLGCLAHAAALVQSLAAVGLWSPDPRLAGRLIRTIMATTVMALGLAVGLRAFAEPGAAALAVLCFGGLALYAATAWMTGALTRDDVASLTKKP
jgi:putative peptidoglycan lipid II flippase